MDASKPITLLLLAALSLPALGQAPPRHKPGAKPAAKVETYSALVRDAEAAIEKGDFAAAEPKLLQATTSDPKDYRAWFDLGFVYSSTDRKSQAIEAYRRSVELKPDIFESNLNLGLLLAGAGDAAAEQYLKAAVKLKPVSDPERGQARAWIALGRILQPKDAAAALSAYQAASLLTPRDPAPHLASAMLLESGGKYPEAEKEFALAAQLDPSSDEAAAGLANIYMRTRRYDLAEAALRKYIAAQPENASAHLQLGRVLRELGRTDDARAEFAAALKLDPKDVAVLRELAAGDALAGRYAEAEAQYRSLVDRQPADADLRYSLASALLQQRKYAEAEQEFLRVVQLKPDDAQAYGDLAIAAAENKHYELAIKALDERARYLPEMPGTYFLRATSYDNLRAYPQAADFYHKFLGSAAGKYPDQEWQARHRLLAIEPKGKKK
jgi:tetratricopeptide (TPR) repeat protein